MADPFSLVAGVLSILGLVVQAASGAMTLVDNTVTAHGNQQRAIRNLRRDLDKTIRGTENMQTVLSVMLEDPKDKTVQRLCKECAAFEIVPPMQADPGA